MTGKFHTRYRALLLILLGTSLPGLLAGCSVNPVTGESNFVLLSENEEIAEGRRNHQKIVDHFGEYDDPRLQQYVNDIGRGLAAVSHRSNLIYRFTVLDSADVNAFALPGGYIYVTRGLLAYLNSEAQLAAVLGHEIGHVTARHAVRQHSAAATTGVLASILASQTGVPGAGSVLNATGTALVRGYGRAHELEADKLGAQYLARQGYDPRAMLEVIRVLKNQEQYELKLAKQENRQPKVYHGLFASHPDNDTRLQRVIGEAQALARGKQLVLNQERYLQHIDGLVYGDSESAGVRRGQHFYHGKLNFALTFPAGWQIDNLPNALVARPPGNDAVLVISVRDINRRISPRDFMRQRLQLDKLKNTESFTHNNLQGYTAISRTNTPYGKQDARFTVLYYNDQAFVFSGAAKAGGDPYRYDGQFLETVRSFRPLGKDELPLAQPMRVRLLTATPATQYEDLARRSRIPNHPQDQLRLLNQVWPDGETSSGNLIKVVE